MLDFRATVRRQRVNHREWDGLTETATNVGSTISFLMFGFAGVMFPTEALPGVPPDLIPYAVPHTAVIEAIRGITLNGAGITGYGNQILIGIAWLVLAFAAATLSYRFTEDR